MKKTKTEKKEEIEKLEKGIEQLNENWKRALADYQNLERRNIQEKKEFIKWANAKLIDKLLNVLDNLEKTVDHLRDKGLQLTLNQLVLILKSEGVEEIKVIGEEFDPETMDAVEITKGKNNKVMEVVLKGYLLNDRILRPAKVKVGKG